MNDDDDDLLAGVDLHAWQVPPPVAAHRPSILVRALAPATPPRKRRIGWMIAGALAVNAAIVAILLVVLRPPAPAPVVLPAGGPTVDAKVQELLARLRAEQAELERRLAEIEEMQAVIEELSAKVKSYEERDRKKTLPKDAKQPPPDAKQPANPYPPSDCDEVSCVLNNYDRACCAKFKKVATPPPGPPEHLDRASISAGIASVKAVVRACGAKVTTKGTVKLRVNVAPSGLVTGVVVQATPTSDLGACVAAAVNRAVFPTTKNGGQFSYPFEFVPAP